MNKKNNYADKHKTKRKQISAEIPFFGVFRVLLRQSYGGKPGREKILLLNKQKNWEISG